MSALRFVPVAFLVLASFGVARADTFQYMFMSGSNGFSFDEPSILTSDTTIPALSLLWNSYADLVSVEINPVSPTCGSVVPPGEASCIFLQFSNNSGFEYFFTSPLTSPGVYSGGVTLTISQEVGASPVPEPSTLALLVAGVMATSGLARGFLRRRSI